MVFLHFKRGREIYGSVVLHSFSGFSRREAGQPSKVVFHVHFFHHLFYSILKWDLLNYLQIELIPIKIMVTPGIKPEYFIFLSRLSGFRS